jgi:hypothetical protein
MILLVKQLKERETEKTTRLKIQFHIVMFAYIKELEWDELGSDRALKVELS